MPILSARYIVDGKLIKEYTRDQINSQLYHTELRGFLYCPTSTCPARVTHYSGKHVFLKTWNNDNHDENCIHGFERVRGRVGVDTTRFINVELSRERKKRALKEALAQYNMTESEVEQRKQKRVDKKNNPTTIDKRSQPSANLVLVNGDAIEGGENISFRGPNLPKRTPDMLKDVDKGKPRLVMGVIKDVIIDGPLVQIIVIEKGTEIHIKFEEAFYVNSPTYSGLFHHIRKYLSEVEKVVFAGIGEIRASRNGDHFELSVFYGEDFEINGLILTALAVRYSKGA